MKDNYKPGKKQFSRNNNGNSFNNGRSGDFKRGGGKSFDSNRSDRPYSPDKPKKFDRFDNNKSGDFKRFDKPDRSDRPGRTDRFGGKPDYLSKNRDDNFKKFNKFDKKFDRFDNKDNKFEKKIFGGKPKFEKKIERKFEKFEKSDKKFEKKSFGDIPDVIVSNVEQEDSGMVYGRNAVLELLKSGKSIDKLFVQSGQREGSITMIFAEAVKKSIPIIEVEKIKLDSMINNSAHQGVIALASEKDYCSVDDILQIAEERNEKPFILIADRIMDPHNLGALIRTAECAGVHGIIIPKRHAAGVSPIVTKTSAGASIYMAIAKVANIANTIEDLKDKGVWTFASALDLDPNSSDIKEIKDYTDADYDIPVALVVGNEGEGLSPIVIQKSDFLVKIPMLGKIESLNVSCASAVLMYEAARQRKQK